VRPVGAAIVNLGTDREKRRRRHASSLTRVDSAIAGAHAVLEDLEFKRSRILDDVDAVDTLTDETIDAFERKHVIKDMHTEVRLAFTAEKRKPKKGDTDTSVRVFVFVFASWRKAGFPNDGVVLLVGRIATAVGLSERQVRRILHNPMMTQFLHITKTPRRWLYRPCVETYADALA
jgi:hypothetical protein